MIDKDTPLRIKSLILGDLLYFVSPIDTVPDVVPLWGFTDDLAVMTATIAYIAAHIKPEHKQKAEELASQWLSEK